MNFTDRKTPPSMDQWIKEAKKDPTAAECGMYLFHNGIVRKTAKARARRGEDVSDVVGMNFSYDDEKIERAVSDAYKMPGIHHVRVWLNKGELKIGDDIMFVLIGGDIRPNVINALESLVEEIKTNCVSETELY